MRRAQRRKLIEECRYPRASLRNPLSPRVFIERQVFHLCFARFVVDVMREGLQQLRRWLFVDIQHRSEKITGTDWVRNARVE